MAGFVGFVQLASTLDVAIVAKNSSNVPTDADSAPTYRVYSAAGFMLSGTLSTFKDTGTITGATQASPTVYTSVGHNLTVGTKITTSGATPSGYNTTGTITAVTSNTFTIAVNNTGAAYVSGGTWHVAGLYDFSITPTIGLNFASGGLYSVFVYGSFSSVVNAIDNFTFIVT